MELKCKMSAKIIHFKGTFQNHFCTKTEVSRKIRKYCEPNKTKGNSTTGIAGDAGKAEFRGKFLPY